MSKFLDKSINFMTGYETYITICSSTRSDGIICDNQIIISEKYSNKNEKQKLIKNEFAFRDNCAKTIPCPTIKTINLTCA